MVMLMDFTPNEAQQRLMLLRTIPFRDVLFRTNWTPTSSTGSNRKRKGRNEYSGFGLGVRDCLEALNRAKGLRWVDLAQREQTNGNGANGFDADEYEFLDNPLNADLHEVCFLLELVESESVVKSLKCAQVIPGKLLVMHCPREIEGKLLWEDKYVDGRCVPARC